MIIFPTFYKRFIFRRTGQLGKLHDLANITELPRASVLHLIDDNFSFNKPITFVPNINSWALSLKPPYKFIHHVKEPPAPKLLQYPEYFRLPMPGLNMAINNFRKANMRFVKPLKDLMDMPVRLGVMCVINYNPLFRARIFGMRRSVRRFNYVWNSMLNMLVTLPETHMHFIPIPVGTSQFEKSAFMTSFKAYTKSTIKFPDDQWYLFMMHLIGYLHKEKTESLFEKIPESLRSKIHFILYGRTKVFIFNLEDMKRMNGDNDAILIRFIKTLNLLAEDSKEPIVTTLVDQIDQTQFKGNSRDDIEETFDEDAEDFETSKSTKITNDTNDKIIDPETTNNFEPKQVVIPELINPVMLSNDPEYHTEKEQPKVVKKVVTVEEPNSLVMPDLIVDTTQGLANKKFRKNAIIQQVKKTEQKKEDETSVKEPEESATIKLPELENIDEINTDILTVQKQESKLNTHNRVRDIPPKEVKAFTDQYIVDLDTRALNAIENNATRLTPAQKTRAKKMSVQYKSIKFNDTPIIDILTTVPEDTISTNSLDFLKDKVPDPSMLKSSVQSFDHDYIQKMMQKDLITNLVSFNSQGMFLKEVATEDVSDELDKMIKYKAKYEDIHHKEHTIKFTLPRVDSDGYCMVNGTKKVLKKQRVIVPICKISNTRVTLNSDYNKFLVERNVAVAHSLLSHIDKIIKSADPKAIIAIINGMSFQNETLPYDYTAIAAKYIKLIIKKDTTVSLYFNYPKRYDWLNKEMNLTKIDIDSIKSIEDETGGVFFGVTKQHTAIFMMLSGEVKIFNYHDNTLVTKDICIMDLLCSLLDVDISHLSEWVDFKLLNKSVPVAFALCYRYGLNYMLAYTKTKYQLVPKNSRISLNSSDIVIRFADAKLIIPRAPLINSLIFAGLNNFDLSKVELEAMNTKDIYFELLQSKGISTHNLKGIDDYFELFVDPITRDVLFQMGEPTDPKDLLIRATQLLSTEDYLPPASEANYRYRSYERFNTAVYKSIARAYATYKNKSVGATNKMSISDYEVKQLIIQDQLMENVDTINPINDIKYRAEYSHSGFGGRQSVDTFMLDDRQFPDDGIGTMSEATVDNAKTGYAASMTVDPVITNMRGMSKTVNINELEPTQILSISSMLVPCVTNDDGKRRSKCAAYR